MMASIYSGVSGVKAQQTKLDIIAHNIANVNTPGYKQKNVTFSDTLSKTISGATGPSGGRGGTNPMQLGLGVRVAATSTDMTSGTPQTTGRAMDAAINGNGFFIVQGGSNGKYQFTRSGNFDIDTDGNLNVNGYTICGWTKYTVDADGNYIFDTQKTVEPINLYSDPYNGNKKVMSPKATTSATIKGRLNPNETAQGSSLKDIRSCSVTTGAQTGSGNLKYTASDFANMVGLSNNGAYKLQATVSGNPPTTTLDLIDSANNVVATGALNSDGSANLTQANNSGVYLDLKANANVKNLANGDTLALSTTLNNLPANYKWPATTTSEVFDAQGNAYDLKVNYTKCCKDPATGKTSWYWEATTTVNGVSQTAGKGYLLFDASNNLVTNDPNYDAKPKITINTSATSSLQLPLDMTGISQYVAKTTSSDENASSLSCTNDGYAAGDLAGSSMDDKGVIWGTYSNNQKKPLGKVALATFNNPDGLERIGDNLYAATANSGNFTNGVPVGSDGTKLTTGALEMSNVSLADQFSEMMITQRGYQASSKIITASDECLQTLINIIK